MEIISIYARGKQMWKIAPNAIHHHHAYESKRVLNKFKRIVFFFRKGGIGSGRHYIAMQFKSVDNFFFKAQTISVYNLKNMFFKKKNPDNSNQIILLSNDFHTYQFRVREEIYRVSSSQNK